MTEVNTYRFSPQQPESKRTIIQIKTTEEKWSAHVHIWQPPTDLFEKQDEYVVRVEIAGMRHAEFLVSLEKRTLVVRGVRKLKNQARAFYRMEISSGEFISVVDLPGPVESDRIEAEYEDGFLTVRLPKSWPSQVDVGG